MTLDDLFVRELDGPFNFVSNRETGDWVLTEETDLSKLEHVKKSHQIVSKKSDGTAMTLLNIGRACNLSCSYCHIDPKKNNDKMSIETGKKAIDRVSELRKEDQTVIFHGSEPLVNYNLIKELIIYGQSKGIVKFGMQTNGTLLDNEKLKFFAKNNVGVGISLDGLKKHHDHTRPFRGGGSSYEKITENISRTIDILGGVSIITVVSNNNVYDLVEITKDFENKGISSVRFSPLYPSNKSHDVSPDLNILTSQMMKVYDNYLSGIFDEHNPIKISNFQELFRTIFAQKETTNCVKCSGGTKQPLMGIDIDGEIYPCDFFWGRKEYNIGNIANTSIEEGIESPNNFRNYRNFDSLEECSPCDWKKYCGSGCPGSSVMTDKGILTKDPYCEHTKAMLEYSIKKIPKLHARGLIKKILTS